MHRVTKTTLYVTFTAVALLCLALFNSSESIQPLKRQKAQKTNPKQISNITAVKPVTTKKEEPTPNFLVPANYPSQKPSQPTITLHESNASHSLLSFTLPDFSVKKVTTPSGKVYSQIIAEQGAKNLNRKGYPTLPRYKQQLLVPKNTPIELVLNNPTYTTHRIDTLLPGTGPILRTQTVEEPTCGDFYGSADCYPEAPVFISSSFNFRNMRAVTITINPFIFDAAKQELRVYDQLDFEIKTPDGKLLLENPPVIADFRTRAESEFINYPQATQEYTAVTTRALPNPELGNILIVYANQFKDSLGDFIKWKKSIGFTVETAEYPKDTGSGVQSLKRYIDQRPKVSHIILIGDTQDIPARAYDWKFSDYTDNYSTDREFISAAAKRYPHNETKLHYTDRYYAGVNPRINNKIVDLVADKFISRISSSDVATVEKQLTQIMDYESGKYLDTNSQWLEQMLMVASNKGMMAPPFYKKDYEHLNEISTKLIAKSHYIQADKLYEEDGDASTPLATKDGVVQEFEFGRGLTYYLGHGSNSKWVSSGFDSDAAQALKTNHKPSLVIEPVCNNGQFYLPQPQCLAENQMKGEGAIGVLASPSETYWNPPVILLEKIADQIIENKFKTVGGIISSGIDSAITWASSHQGDTVDKTTAVQMLYFGDCSMSIRTRKPQALNLSTSQTFDQHAQTIQVTAPAGSKVSLWHEQEIIDTATADTNGQVILQRNETPFERYTVKAWKPNSFLVEKNNIEQVFMHINIPPNGSDSENLLNLAALFNGSVTLPPDSKFEIVDGQLRYKTGATRNSEESIKLQWTSKSGIETSVTIGLDIADTPNSAYSFDLVKGWNLVGSPIDSTTPLRRRILSPSTELAIYNWDQAKGVYYRPDKNQNLKGQQGFWICATVEGSTEPFSGVSTRGVMTELKLGWNLYSPIQEMPKPLGAVNVWKWDAKNEQYKQISETETLNPLTGYWIFMNP